MFKFPSLGRQILIILLTIESRSRNKERFPGVFKFPLSWEADIDYLIDNRKPGPQSRKVSRYVCTFFFLKNRILII